MSEEKKNLVLSKAEFDLFIGWHKHYLKEFGQIAWNCEYVFQNVDNCYAKTFYNLHNKTATVYFSKDWPEVVEFSTEKVQRTAKHEVQHLITARLYIVALDRFCNKDEIDDAEEELVRLLDKLILL